MADDALINGDGSTADFAAAYGDQFAENQTAYDAADNGTLNKTNDVATYTPPAWLTNITGLVNAGASLAGTVTSTVGAFTNKPAGTSAAQATKANTQAGAVPAASGAKSYLPWIIGGVIALVAAVLFLRK